MIVAPCKQMLCGDRDNGRVAKARIAAFSDASDLCSHQTLIAEN
jgi:hypothetical protein